MFAGKDSRRQAFSANVAPCTVIIQWIASERARKSIIPVGFWECSAIGSILLLIYFAFYRHDSVGVLSALFPLPVYLRNLYFRYTHHHPKHPGNEPRPPD
jgi:lipid-A-disaccharide synthase-like uncharacterized protein